MLASIFKYSTAFFVIVTLITSRLLYSLPTPDSNQENIPRLSDDDIHSANSTNSTSSQNPADCFKFCLEWWHLLVFSMIVLLSCCLCAALSQQQPREIWYMVERPSTGQLSRPIRAQPMRKPWIFIDSSFAIIVIEDFTAWVYFYGFFVTFAPLFQYLRYFLRRWSCYVRWPKLFMVFIKTNTLLRRFLYRLVIILIAAEMCEKRIVVIYVLFDNLPSEFRQSVR